MKTIVAVGILTLVAGAAVAQDKTTEPAAIVASSSSTSDPAAQVCTAPSAPTPWSPEALPAKPGIPSCLNLKTHTSTCSKTVLDRYNAAVETRNNALSKQATQGNDYVDALNHYTRAVNDYNNCEVHRINAAVQALNK